MSLHCQCVFLSVCVYIFQRVASGNVCLRRVVASCNAHWLPWRWTVALSYGRRLRSFAGTFRARPELGRLFHRQHLLPEPFMIPRGPSLCRRTYWQTHTHTHTPKKHIHAHLLPTPPPLYSLSSVIKSNFSSEHKIIHPILCCSLSHHLPQKPSRTASVSGLTGCPPFVVCSGLKQLQFVSPLNPCVKEHYVSHFEDKGESIFVYLMNYCHY